MAKTGKFPYYVGLDCGTNSVGWAATDEEYRLLKAYGKSEWGVRLFDEAEPAAERRVARSNRRRGERAKTRLKLLRRLFSSEMSQVDPEFYQRLHESFYYEEDKKLTKNSKNTLFNDPGFTDKDFHEQYPTIWHLRRAIIHAGPDQHFDLRLYFLAVQHILKHRGHFLMEGSLAQDADDFQGIYRDFVDIASGYGYILNDSVAEQVKNIILDKVKDADGRRMGKRDKKNAVAELLRTDETDDDPDNPKNLAPLAGLLVGSSVSLKDLFDLEGDCKVKVDFSKDDLEDEDKKSEISEAIGADNMDLIFTARTVYDYGVLHNLLGEHKFVSDAMVANYDQHKKDLEALKAVFKPHPGVYRQLFRSPESDSSYDRYVGKGYTLKADRHKSITPMSQEDFNKILKKHLESVGYSGELLERAERGELLPKQRGQAKGTIPQQLHHRELELILRKLGQDFPSFAEEDPNEKSAAKTKIQKILAIHEFRIPYYVGPLVKRKFDQDGNPIAGGRSEFSWADQEISELVYPWNFDDLVDKDARATNFIRRMTNECTYLPGEQVLPKDSLDYQKYMVLNELNNLKIDGHRIDNGLKQKIYEEGFLGDDLLSRSNITMNKLNRWLKERGLIDNEQELGGASETKFLPRLTTHHDFHRILGVDFEHKYSRAQLNEVVEVITILNEDKAMLRRRLAIILKLPEDSSEVKNLAKLKYQKWGNFSNQFLNGLRVQIDGRDLTILEALWETNANLTELLGDEYGFGKAVDDYNRYHCKAPRSSDVTYRDVDALYCSPAVKRSIWQTFKIVDELVRVNGCAPAKIFLEVTRDGDKQDKKGYTTSRKKNLEERLKSSVRSADTQAILKELEGKSDRDLQSKKLFLYFSQMGKCAYCGKPIDLEELNNWQLYDIDHIFPRSLTKDDSITQNLVLVHAQENRDKTNVYPVSEDVRKRMSGVWYGWHKAQLITDEKYKRLIRATPLTADELGGFIARQIVETSQSVKAIRDLLERAYPEAKVVMVKAHRVSDLRSCYGYDKKDQEGNVVRLGRPEFIKLRELNDYHHAKDAYLNIVVGNVMNSTFTDNPSQWVRNRQNQNYTITTERIFRDSYKYQKKDGTTSTWPDTAAWHYADSLKVLSDTLKQNDILWTRMNYIESGMLSDQQLVGKSAKVDGIMPIKQKSRLDPKKYGGYNSLKGAHFTLVEQIGKKGERERRIIAVPQTVGQHLDPKSPQYFEKLESYVASEYPDSKIIIPIIKYKTLLEVDGVPLHITGRTGKSLLYQHCRQLTVPESLHPLIKRILSVSQKDKQLSGKYEIDEDKDGVDVETTKQVFDELMKFLPEYGRVPGLSTVVSKIGDNREKFQSLDLKEQCHLIVELLKIFSCSAERGNLEKLIPKPGYLVLGGNKVNTTDSCYLIEQSPTGFFEHRVNLKTTPPRNPKILKRTKPYKPLTTGVDD